MVPLLQCVKDHTYNDRRPYLRVSGI